MKAVALDVETANGSIKGSICSVGLCVIEDGRVVREYYTLCNPLTSFDPFCVRVHGIIAPMVDEAPELEAVMRLLAQELQGGLLIAHNAAFDHGQLCAAAQRFDVPWPQYQVCCTVQLARKAFPKRPSYSLGALRDLIDQDFVHHHALEDARACAALWLKCQQVLATPCAQ